MRAPPKSFAKEPDYSLKQTKGSTFPMDKGCRSVLFKRTIIDFANSIGLCILPLYLSKERVMNFRFNFLDTQKLKDL